SRRASRSRSAQAKRCGSAACRGSPCRPPPGTRWSNSPWACWYWTCHRLRSRSAPGRRGAERGFVCQTSVLLSVEVWSFADRTLPVPGAVREAPVVEGAVGVGVVGDLASPLWSPGYHSCGTAAASHRLLGGVVIHDGNAPTGTSSTIQRRVG